MMPKSAAKSHFSNRLFTVTIKIISIRLNFEEWLPVTIQHNSNGLQIPTCSEFLYSF